MAADEATVERIITETLNKYGGGSSDPDVMAASVELYKRRNSEPALIGDENYAIAEHYLLSRAWVATSFVPLEQMLAMIHTYNALKKVAQKSALLELVMRHDPAKPMAPPSELDIRKSEKGAWDGEKQRIANGRLKPQFNPKAGAGYSGFKKAATG